jgi:GTP-binding protein
VLIDSRHETQKVDMEFMQWLGESEIPFAVIFTKADKQSKTRTKLNIENYIQQMLEQWEEMPPYFVTSAVSREGREEILNFIDTLNKNHKQP